ncbi:MAG: hypothetical protein KME18_23165 [Phormidium tanganyikae FI6-MK23]|jgi:hypothetical protein|nr:hypothetical protein [Phormidium tanganyikae FI6-MK23]
MRRTILVAGLFALGFFMLGGRGKMTIADHSNVRLIGETVTISYVADPGISRGQFRLENHGTTAISAKVEAVWLEREEQEPLTEISIFDLAQEQTVSSEHLVVQAGAAMTFLAGFPRIAYEPQFGETVAVGLRLIVDGVALEALSPIEFVRRIPRRS